MVYEKLKQKLNQRQTLGNFRTLHATTNLIDFTSNDYLGFARSKDLKQAILKEWERLSITHAGTGWGATGSRLLTGHHTYFEEVEKEIAQFHEAEAGVIFNTGYMANQGLLSCLADTQSLFLFDMQIHASMREGLQKSKDRAYPFRHNDVEHLEQRLKKVKGDVFVCVEALYSMDGSLCPLKLIAELCARYGAHLIVDEAHSTGILGMHGKGLVHALGLQSQVFARVHTFGKALGVHGAVVLGNSLLKDYLINFSAPLIYTTCLPIYSLAAIRCAYQQLPLANQQRSHLSLLERFFNKSSPIIPIVVGGNEKTKEASAKLASLGFDVRPVLSPTVKRGEECLRLCLHAFNTREEVIELMNYL